MLKQWKLVFDEIAVSGSILPLWPAVKSICAELARQGYLREEKGRFQLTPHGFEHYKTERGEFIAQALAHIERRRGQK